MVLFYFLPGNKGRRITLLSLLLVHVAFTYIFSIFQLCMKRRVLRSGYQGTVPIIFIHEVPIFVYDFGMTHAKFVNEYNFVECVAFNFLVASGKA